VTAPQTQSPFTQLAELPQSASASHAHRPAEQMKPDGHANPQAPQLVASVCRFRQPAGVSQHTCPAVHAAPVVPQVQSRALFRRGQTSPSLHSTASHTQRRVATLQVAVPPPPPTRHWASVVQPQCAFAQTKPVPWSAQELLQPPQF